MKLKLFRSKGKGMLGEFVVFPTKDNLEMEGFFSKTRSKKAIVFIHGLTGRMNGKDLIRSVYYLSKSLGYNFLMFNNRGFGLINKIYASKKDKKSKVIGAGFERFTDCKHDIQAAVNFLKKRGCNKIFLIGHSTGCQKSSYYLSQIHDKNVKGVVLLAPCNDTDAEIMHGGEKVFKKRLNHAKKLIKNNKKKEFIGLFTAERYYGLHCGVESKIFDYTKKKLNYISKIKVPILAILGGSEEHMAQENIEKSLQLIKDSANVKCKTIVVKNANHHYSPNLKGMIKVLGGWLKRFK